MAKMTGGEAMVKSLYGEGVRVVFGLPGVQLYHAMDAFYHEPRIRFINTRHEQAAAYMAFGYSMAGDDIGTALVVPGPGLQNASAAIGTAYAVSCPVMVVAGQIDRDYIGRDRGELHEINDQLDIIRPVTKWSSRVLKAHDAPAAVHEAFRQLRSGRPRPVEIEIPPDVLAEVDEVELLEPASPVPAAPTPESVSEGARLLAASTDPAIVAGGGAIISGATEALQKLAEHLQAPVATTAEAKGAISDRHYLSVGVCQYFADQLSDRLKRCDVILAVGTRMVDMKVAAGQTVVQIDVDGDEIGRNHPNTVGVQGDARLALEALYRVLSDSTPPRASRRDEFEAVRTARSEAASRLEPQMSFVRAIRSAMPEDGILIEGVTQIGYACLRYYPVYVPGTYVTSSYYGNLGYAYPTALGAKVAQPDRAVVAVSGDGGFLYNSQELATAVKHGIGAVVIVFNDGAFGNVLRDQKTQFGGRVIGSELHNPDFVKLAEAYGARGVLAQGPEEMESALREALEIQAPTLIEVPVGMMPSPW